MKKTIALTALLTLNLSTAAASEYIAPDPVIMGKLAMEEARMLQQEIGDFGNKTISPEVTRSMGKYGNHSLEPAINGEVSTYGQFANQQLENKYFDFANRYHKMDNCQTNLTCSLYGL